MYIRSIRDEGIPAGLYRHTSEIRRDMDIVEKKIREIEEKLSVRNLVADIIDSGKQVIDEGFIEPDVQTKEEIDFGEILFLTLKLFMMNLLNI